MWNSKQYILQHIVVKYKELKLQLLSVRKCELTLCESDSIEGRRTHFPFIDSDACAHFKELLAHLQLLWFPFASVFTEEFRFPMPDKILLTLFFFPFYPDKNRTPEETLNHCFAWKSVRFVCANNEIISCGHNMSAFCSSEPKTSVSYNMSPHQPSSVLLWPLTFSLMLTGA